MARDGGSVSRMVAPGRLHGVEQVLGRGAGRRHDERGRVEGCLQVAGEGAGLVGGEAPEVAHDDDTLLGQERRSAGGGGDRTEVVLVAVELVDHQAPVAIADQLAHELRDGRAEQRLVLAPQEEDAHGRASERAPRIAASTSAVRRAARTSGVRSTRQPRARPDAHAATTGSSGGTSRSTAHPVATSRSTLAEELAVFGRGGHGGRGGQAGVEHDPLPAEARGPRQPAGRPANRARRTARVRRRRPGRGSLAPRRRPPRQGRPGRSTLARRPAPTVTATGTSKRVATASTAVTVTSNAAEVAGIELPGRRRAAAPRPSRGHRPREPPAPRPPDQRVEAGPTRHLVNPG